MKAAIKAMKNGHLKIECPSLVTENGDVIS